MIFLVLFIFLLCAYGIKIVPKGFFPNFLERNQTNSIKGVFILFVFIRHILQYVVKSGYTFSSFGDGLFLKLGCS